jgi:hypothetical protein
VNGSHLSNLRHNDWIIYWEVLLPSRRVHHWTPFSCSETAFPRAELSFPGEESAFPGWET